MTGTYDSASAYDLATVTFDGGAAGDLTNLPVLGVFIAFDNDPYDADPDWEEITSYVRDVSISRGRSDDYSQFPAGTASLTLNNRNRVFDPFNTSSPYAGKLLPRKQIKIVAQSNGSNYTIFRGYCAGFPVKFINNGADSTITLDCFDAFGLIAATELPIDWSYLVISELEPINYWRCDDPAGAVFVTDRGTGNLVASPTSQYAADSQKSPSLAKGLAFDASNSRDGYYDTGLKAGFPINALTFGGFLQCNYPTGYNTSIFCGMARIRIGNLYAAWWVNYTLATGQIALEVDVRSDTVRHRLGWFDVVTTTEPMHIAISVNANPFEYKIFLNGTEITDTPDILSEAVNNTYGFFFWLSAGQEFFVVDEVLSPAKITEIYNAGIANLVESTADRAQRLLNLTGLPSELIDITDLPVGTVSSVPTNGFVLPALQRTADSEGGEVFTSRDGVITFVNRYKAFTNGSTAAFTVPFGEQSGGQPFSDQLEIMYDADSIRNDVAVQFSDGGQVTASSPSSIAAYGRSDETISTDLASVADAQSLATLEATVSSLLEPTISPIQIGTTRSASEWANILNMDLLDQYSVSYTPSTGSAFSQNLLLNRITYDITPSAWQVTIAGSSRLCGWFCADVSLTNGSDVVL